MKIRYSAPGKLVISGEWAILEVGNLGLIAAVNNRVSVEVEDLTGYDGISITANDFGIHDVRAKVIEGKIIFMNADDKTKEILKLLGEAIKTSLIFLHDIGIKMKPFKISTDSKDTQIEVDGKIKKIGFGSSAAVVVAAVGAILDFHDYKATREEIYKLATIAHFYAQGKAGSAFDVAASAFGGLFVYSRFDPKWLTEKIEANEKISAVVKEEWPSLIIENVKVSEDFKLLVGWTGDSASTSEMIKQMNEFKSVNREKYYEIFNSIAKTSSEAIEAFRTHDKNQFISLLNQNEDILRQLTLESKVSIETHELKVLHDVAKNHDAAGKLSGAGGGDCGIGICFDNRTAEKIKQDWVRYGLHIVDTTIDLNGLRREN